MLSEQAAEGEEPRMQGFSVHTYVRPQSGKQIRFRAGMTVARGRHQRVRVHTLLLPQSRLPVVSALPTRCAGRLPPCTASSLLTKGVTTAFAFVRARIKTKKSNLTRLLSPPFQPGARVVFLPVPRAPRLLLTKGVTTAFAFVRARIKAKKSAILEVSADRFLRRDSEVSHCEIARTRDGLTRSTSCNRLPRPCTY